MGLSEKMPLDDFAVRLGQDEIALIFNLKEDLDHAEQLVSHAARYQELGWQPRAVSASDASDLEVDFSQPEEAVYEQIKVLRLSEEKIHLGIPTPGPARLLIVEIRGETGMAALDQLGDWRAKCWAHSEEGWEQHFFALPPGFPAPQTISAPDLEITVYGEGGLALIPPSPPPTYHQAWVWVEPPWEIAPGCPESAIWQFLMEQRGFSQHPDPRLTSGLPSWEEIYPLIAPSGEVIRALVAPAASFEHYYERLLDTALGFGLTDPTLLLSLLWHAPMGDLRERLERWPHLQYLAAMAPFRRVNETVRQRQALEEPIKLHLSPLESPTQSGASPATGQAQGATAGDPQVLPSADIFSFMDKRVILERGRYEAMISEMSELAAKSADLERRLAEQETRLQALPSSAPSATPPPAVEAPPDKGARASGDRVAAMARHPQGQRHQGGVQAALREFLSKNPDLDEQDRVQMLHFYLNNYIDINPENYGLPFLEKLEMAAKMVRDFLGE
jgi:hypothetical protein